MSSAPKKRSSLLSVLKVLLGLTVLGAAIAMAPWSDAAILRSGEREWLLEGAIHGAWNGSVADFLPNQESQASQAWPTPWPDSWPAELQGGDEVVRLDRDLADPSEGPVDWRPGLPTVLSGLRWQALVLGLAVFLVGLSASVLRWWRLLALVGCATRLSSVFRLTFLGLFFNLVVPGLTGGDLVKVVMVVREHPHRRADAFVSTVVDRILGVTGLLILASAVILLAGSNLEDLRLPVLALTVSALMGLVVVVHPAPRRLVRLDKWIRKLPQADRLESLDRAVLLYGAHPWQLVLALLISIFNHACNAFAIYLIATSMGSALSYIDTLSAASIASLVSAVPLSPGGLGVEEAVYAWLFGLLGSTGALGLAVGLTKRAMFTLLGLSGGLFLLAPSAKTLKSDLEVAKESSS